MENLYECQTNPFLTEDKKVYVGKGGSKKEKEKEKEGEDERGGEMSAETALVFSLPTMGGSGGGAGGGGDAAGMCTVQLLLRLHAIHEELLGIDEMREGEQKEEEEEEEEERRRETEEREENTRMRELVERRQLTEEQKQAWERRKVERMIQKRKRKRMRERRERRRREREEIRVEKEKERTDFSYPISYLTPSFTIQQKLITYSREEHLLPLLNTCANQVSILNSFFPFFFF